MPPPKFAPNSFWLAFRKFPFTGSDPAKHGPHHVKNPLQADHGTAVEESSLPERWRYEGPKTRYPPQFFDAGILMMGSSISE